MWMKKLVTLAKDPLIKVSSRITSFLEPEYIYLPIDEEIRQNIDYKKVKKGDLLYSWQGKKQYSPVSGKIVGFLQNSQGLFLKFLDFLVYLKKFLSLHKVRLLSRLK